MFGKLKEKLRGLVKNLSRTVEEDVAKEAKEERQVDEEIIKQAEKEVAAEERHVEKPKPPAPKPKKPAEKKAQPPKKERTAKKEEKPAEPKPIIPKIIPEVLEKPAAKEEPPREPPAKKRSLAEKLGFAKSKPEEPPAKQKEQPAEKKTFLGTITQKTVDEADLKDTLWNFQMALLENDVALETAEKIVADIKSALVGSKISRGSTEKVIKAAVEKSMREIMVEGFDLIERIKSSEKPFKIVFIGINGTGKTTTIAKVAMLCKKNGLEPVLAASDTFRAASIEQLEHHARNLGVKIVKHNYGSDAAAVAYDAVEHAKANGKPVVLIDTAGRMHSNQNLMDELKKIDRVIKPDLFIFIGDAMTGNDATEQAKEFNNIRVDAVILSKADTDPKGGSCISIQHTIRKPILYLGTGQTYDDLTKFTPEWFLQKIL
ncbi:MAG: signal recognition particle-docking protein FtsY [archaeon]